MEYNKPPPYNPNEAPQPYPQQQQYLPQHVPQQYPQQHFQQHYPPMASQPIAVTVQPPAQNTVIITGGQVVTGNCPGCRRGNLGYSFTCCGVLCAIIFFPVGIICCFLFAQKRCSHCGGLF